ncbi:MAG: nitrous oxide reductase family maturation protein NosD, partial [Flavobacterium sp.]|nr:nitrous oxide reductase family maturation protein NosD [Flavobacterium sp.]
MKKLLYIFLFFSSLLQAAVIEVGPNKPIKSIKKAIALSKVGDTVLVHKGWYKEGNIIINKRIVFIGKNYPILDGQKKFEVLSIKADGVIVKGFKVIKSGYATLEDPCGIKVYNKKNVVIQNNILDD